jgi:hypothetical protein
MIRDSRMSVENFMEMHLLLQVDTSVNKTCVSLLNEEILVETIRKEGQRIKFPRLTLACKLHRSCLQSRMPVATGVALAA